MKIVFSVVGIGIVVLLTVMNLFPAEERFVPVSTPSMKHLVNDCVRLADVKTVMSPGDMQRLTECLDRKTGAP